MNQATSSNFRPKLWVAGDLNAFFGLFSNVMLNVLVLTGLTLGMVKIPSEIVFGRILPALGIALSLGNIYYAYITWQLAKKEQRDTVTALPYGPSVPQMFIVTLLVMMPAYIKTNDHPAYVLTRAAGRAGAPTLHQKKPRLDTLATTLAPHYACWRPHHRRPLQPSGVGQSIPPGRGHRRPQRHHSLNDRNMGRFAHQRKTHHTAHHRPKFRAHRRHYSRAGARSQLQRHQPASTPGRPRRNMLLRLVPTPIDPGNGSATSPPDYSPPVAF